MPTATQIEKIEGLSVVELNDLLIKILSKQEFESIELLEDCIKAKQKTFLNTSAAVFTCQGDRSVASEINNSVILYNSN